MIAGAAAFSEMLTSDTLSSDKLTSAVGADAARSASDERGVLLLLRLGLGLGLGRRLVPGLGLGSASGIGSGLLRLGSLLRLSMELRRLELPRLASLALPRLASRLMVGWRLGLGRFELSRRRDRPKSSSCG